MPVTPKRATAKPTAEMMLKTFLAQTIPEIYLYLSIF
jgi:hypothetical protein